ncbi:unnamed protein product [Lactuca virosa]|uniref:F-box domain-containing protein n=1 Tax=Lactuca virosa TaxID=75947 RepID=A0AAU9N582_9ASTR|nr:unnamed protein product [Lactuca virosa]
MDPETPPRFQFPAYVIHLLNSPASVYGDGERWKGSPYESGGAEEKPRKRPFRPEINEEPQIVCKEAGRNNSTGGSDEGANSTSISASTGVSELQQMCKQKTFTWSEIQHPTTMEKLPDDALVNIFIRLLAKQVAQMRSVSKSWNAFLSHPSFIKSHLHHSINNKDRLLLVFYNETSSSDPEPFTVHPCRSPHIEHTNSIKLPAVNPKSGHTTSSIRIIGSVHGLICSRYGFDVIHIWNPSISTVSTLPPHYIPSGDHSYDIYFRFGFDPKTEDYKVVKIIGLTGTLPHIVKEWLQVEVYSMKRDGHGGYLHWHAFIRDQEEGELETIVAFDLGSETFREIPFPDSLLDSKRSNALGGLGGKLCVMSWYEEDDVCEVWVMYEYGVTESWAKHYVMSHLHLPNGVGYGFTSHNEVLIVDDDFRIVLYDPTAGKAKILDKFCHGNDSMEKFVEYVDSLIWVAPPKHEMSQVWTWSHQRPPLQSITAPLLTTAGGCNQIQS